MPHQYLNFDAPNRPQLVSIRWEMETPRDDYSDRPDERDDGFWPSRDPSTAGYVGAADFDAAQEAAEARMAAWEAGDWEYIGVVAVAHVAIPIGGGSFCNHTFRSAGCWGIESDSGDYLEEVFREEQAELLAQLKTLGAALASDCFEQSEA